MVKTEENKIILLEDLFREFPDQPMNIELKTPTDDSIKEFARLVKMFKREHITIWGTTGKLSEELQQAN